MTDDDPWVWEAKRQAERADRAEAAISSVRALAESARVTMAKGCLCYSDMHDPSTGCRYGEPIAWSLSPADVLAALDSSETPPAAPVPEERSDEKKPCTFLEWGGCHGSCAGRPDCAVGLPVDGETT